MSALRVILADDEPAARAKLTRLLLEHDDVEIVAACENGEGAVSAIERHDPDVVFLDVEMPELDGFSVVERLQQRQRPLVIFVTAFDRYAVRAFDESAADYLLKPFSAGRLAKALSRARTRLDAISTGAAGAAAAVPALDQRLLIRSNGRTSVIPLAEVEWMESIGNYVGVHTARGRLLMRETLTRLIARLDSRVFVRIHRCGIVNVQHVTEIRPTASRGRIIVLRSGSRLRVSRSYRADLERAFMPERAVDQLSSAGQAK